MFEQLAETALATQIKVQGAHAHAHGQMALADGALKAALGGLSPGGMEVLQGVEAEPGRNGQRRRCGLMLQMRFDGVHQRLRIEAEQSGLFFAAKHVAVARAGIDRRADRKQAFA
ncbi:hypothetical protein D3C81_1004980 [compost metagenome]